MEIQDLYQQRQLRKKKVAGLTLPDSNTYKVPTVNTDKWVSETEYSAIDTHIWTFFFLNKGVKKICWRKDSFSASGAVTTGQKKKVTLINTMHS